MELRTESPRKHVHGRALNLCAQCGEAIFLPEWSEYLDRHRVRHLWQCEACGYKYETLVSFPDSVNCQAAHKKAQEPPDVRWLFVCRCRNR